MRFRVKEVLKKYNIKSEDIERVLERVIHVEGDMIATYYRHTWGSCKEWKLLITDVNGNYLPGEWLDRSSRKNAHKFKLTKMSDIPDIVRIFYYESPSCNASKTFSFTIIAEVLKD